MSAARKKFAIVSHSYPCFEGDWRANFVEALARALAKTAEVTVFTPFVKTWTRPTPADANPRLVCFRYLPFDAAHTLGAAPIMKGDLKLAWTELLALPFLALVGTLKLAAAMRREKFDVVQAHWAVPNAFIALAARWLAGAHGTKIFVSFPGSDVTVLTNLGAVGRWLGRRLAGCDYLSCNSSDLKEDLIKLGIPAAKIELVIYGVDDQQVRFDAQRRSFIRAKLGVADRDVFLLMVGRFVPKKGFATGLRALAEIPEAKLFLIGDGAEEGAYRAILAANGAEGRAFFLGRIPLAELSGYYSACDILLMPSRRLPSDGLNVVVPEAMACARPIVASRVGGNDLVVFDGVNGFLHDEDDSGALAARTRELIADLDLRARMGEASLSLIRERFNWDAIARHYLSRS